MSQSSHLPEGPPPLMGRCHSLFAFMGTLRPKRGEARPGDCTDSPPSERKATGTMCRAHMTLGFWGVPRRDKVPRSRVLVRRELWARGVGDPLSRLRILTASFFLSPLGEAFIPHFQKGVSKLQRHVLDFVGFLREG